MEFSPVSNRSSSLHFNISSDFLGFNSDDFVAFRKLLDIINLYVMPLIVLVGLSGNLLSLAVFMGTYLRKESLSVYLAALAIADSGCLIAIFIVWLDVWNVSVYHRNGICQLTVYFTYVCSFLSIWYVVCFMAERYIVICFPLKRQKMCTTYRAKIVTLSMAAVALLGYSFSLWFSGVRQFGSHSLCVHLHEHIAITTALTYIDSLIALVIPILALITMNARIMHKIAVFYKAQKRHFAGREPRDNNRNVSLVNTAQLRITKLMLTISSVFVLINMPSYILKLRLIIISFANKSYLAEPEEFMWQAIFEFVYYINFSINFFLYTICLRKFRIALKKLLKRAKCKIFLMLRKFTCCHDNKAHMGPVEISDLYDGDQRQFDALPIHNH